MRRFLRWCIQPARRFCVRISSSWMGAKNAAVTSSRQFSRLRLRVTAPAEAKVRSGHPWVFASSIREQNRAAGTGELAVIYDKRDRFLALGLYDPDSPLRVRILHRGDPITIDRA